MFQMNITELRTKKETFMNTMRSILDSATSENRSLTTAEQRDFDGLKTKVADIGATLDRASQLGELRAEIEKPIVAGPVQRAEGGMIYGVQRGSLNPGEARAYRHNEALSEAEYRGPGLGAYIRGLVTGKWQGAEELRALGEGSTPGSYLVPQPLAFHVIDLVRNAAQVLRAGAVTIPMESATLRVARLITDVTSGWKSENQTLTYSDANFNQVTFTANMLAAGSKISVEMVEDAFGLDAILMNSIVKSLGLALDYAALYGNGTAPQPTGIKNQSGVALTTLATNGYTLADYSKYSAGITQLLSGNFNGPFSILHSARTAGELDNLQDTLHQPLRQPDNVAAARKFVTNQIPTNLTVGTATTCSDAFVGQFDQCLIGMRTNLALEISRVAADSTGSAFSNAQVWIRAYLRADVQLAHPAAFNVLSGLL
jgi:HK97 family phage major capsid protein